MGRNDFNGPLDIYAGSRDIGLVSQQVNFQLAIARIADCHLVPRIARNEGNQSGRKEEPAPEVRKRTEHALIHDAMLRLACNLTVTSCRCLTLERMFGSM